MFPRCEKARNQPPGALRLAQRCEQLDLGWRAGATLPILFSVDARLERTNLTRVLRRAVRSRRG